MTFLHVAFLGGALAIVVPIVLHLIMRKQPQHLEFPALRFIRQREHANRRQVRLRHWLLLALRCLVLALLAFALARPSVLSSGVLDQEAPVAVALVFDTNPRMQYRQQNKTRLEVAQETAQWLLPQFPPDSDVAVIDSRSGTAAFAVDVGAARQRIERLDARAMTQPLEAAVAAGLKLAHESDKPRKEVYVFTDLARATWSADAMRGLTRQLPAAADVAVYLIDVGVRDPVNFGLGDLRLSGEVLSKNSPLRVACDLVHVGPEAERTVELYLVDPKSGEATVRNRASFPLRAGESQAADFHLRGLEAGVHQGYLKIVGEDSLACDDTRWFTVDVRTAWRVLIAAPQDASGAAGRLCLVSGRGAGAVRNSRQGRERRLNARSSPPTNWPSVRCSRMPLCACSIQSRWLPPFGRSCKLTPRPAVAWASFWVAMLRPSIRSTRRWHKNYCPASSFASGAPARPFLRRFVRASAAGAFRALAGGVPWESFPVFRHWQLDNLAEGSAVVLRYSNGQPAIVERPLGQGRVVTMTTPISDPASRSDTWNLLPTGEQPWPFVMLANEMMLYLAGGSGERLNYTAGDPAVVARKAATRSIRSTRSPLRAVTRFARRSTTNNTP